MKTFKKQSIMIDLFQNTTMPLPVFIQNDHNVMEFTIQEDGETADLSNIGRIVVNYQRPDKKVITRELTAESGVVPYKLGLSEMEIPGRAKVELQFYSQDATERISTKTFKIEILPSIGEGKIETEEEYTLIQTLLMDVKDKVTQVEQSTTNANNAAQYATEQGDKVNDHLVELNDLMEETNTVITNAHNAANNATTQANDALEKGDYAQDQGDYAKSQGDYAKSQGDYAKQEADRLEGTDVSQLDLRIDGLTSQLAQIENSTYKIYGVYWDRTSSPTLTRTDDAVGMVANIGVDGEFVQNDFDNAQIFREIGTVVDMYGNEFVRIPKFYIYKKYGEDFWERKISKAKLPGYYLPWCFWDFENKRELPYIDVGKYKASLSEDSKLESKPNRYPLANKNIVDFRNYARANNDETQGLKGYQQLDIHVWDVLQTLFYVEFATLDSQSIMKGFTSGQYNESHVSAVAETETNRIIVDNSTADQFRVGQTISIGSSRGNNSVFYGRTITAIETYDENNKAIVFDGDPVDIALGDCVYNTGWKNGFSDNIAASSGTIFANDGKYPCVYRGIESPWGDLYQFVDGVNIIDNQAWVANNAEDYASNVFASPYEEVAYANSAENGWVSKMGYDKNNPSVEFPINNSGGSSTYYADYYYQNTGQRIAPVGGSWSYGSDAGLSHWGLNISSGSAHVSLGGRLLKKPL